MNEEDKSKGPSVLRYEEMIQLLDSEKDPITSQLMGFAFMKIFGRWLAGKGLPICDLDGRFFMEIMQEFCSEHENLRIILDGKGESLAWFAEESGTDGKEPSEI